MIICVFATKFFIKFGVPVLILFILAGMLLGSEGIYGIYFDNPTLTKEIGNIALCFIIFSGGIDLYWKASKQILGKGILLSTIGVALTALLLGIFVHYFIGMPLMYALLLGAIVSSTDAASVFAIMRSQKLNIKGNVEPLLEFESGSNDPMACMLTIALIGIINGTADTISGYIIFFLKQFALGGILGVLMGYGTVYIINRLRHNIESMYYIIVISIVMFIYSISSIIGGNAFLAVYIGGIIIGNSSFMRKTRLTRFFDGISWISQAILFITLGLQVFPSRLIPIAVSGAIISLALIFIVRPLVVIPMLSLFKVQFNKQIFISIVGFRGAASIVFATYPLTENIPVAKDIFDIVFFIALFSLIIQGTSLPLFAKKLNLIEEEDDDFTMHNFHHYSDEISDMPVLGVYVPVFSPAVGKNIYDLQLPEDVRIVAIRQAEGYLTPKGTTTITAGDRLLITSLDEDNIKKVCEDLKFES